MNGAGFVPVLKTERGIILMADFFDDLRDADAITIQKYCSILRDAFFHLYHMLGTEVVYGKAETVTVLQGELFVFQPVIGDENNYYTAGFAAEADVLCAAAEDLYEKLQAKLTMPDYGGTREDAIDLFAEFLNTANGFCALKFDSSFDLQLPDYRERAVLCAPQIAVAPMKIFSHAVQVFFIYGVRSDFKEVV